jgi:hypothetical protein
VLRSIAGLLGALMLLAAMPACKGGALDPLDYSGLLGVPQPALLQRNTLSVIGTVDQRPVTLLIDTGSPLPILPVAAFGGGTPGQVRLPAHLLGLDLPALPVVLDVRAGGNPFGTDGQAGVFGLLGGSFLEHFAVSLDYAAATVQLDAQLPAMPAQGEYEVPVVLAGGGAIALADQSRVPIGATRLVVDLELQGVLVRAVVDTGSSITLVGGDVAAAWGISTRPRLEGAQLIGFQGLIGVTYTRIDSVRIGDAIVSDPVVAVLDDNQVLQPIVNEVGADIEALVGGSTLRSLRVRIDYPGQRLRVAPNPAADGLARDTISGVGCFVRDSGDRTLTVSHVQASSPAARAGIHVGDVLLAIDGQSVEALGQSGANTRLLAPAGRQLTLILQTPGTRAARQLTLTAVDLLPG